MGVLFLAAVLLFVVALVAAVAMLRVIERRNARIPPLPGPPADWLTGNTLELLKAIENNHQYFLEGWQQYGDMYRLVSLTDSYVFVSDPDIVKELFSSKAFQDRPPPSLLEGNGFPKVAPYGLLGLPKDDKWAVHRRTISPLFADRFLKIYAADMVASCLELSSLISEHIDANFEPGDGTSVEMHDLVTRLTLDVIGKSGFGTTFSSLKHSSIASQSAGPSAGGEDIDKFMTASRDLVEETMRYSVLPGFIACLYDREKLPNALRILYEAAADVLKNRETNSGEEKQRVSSRYQNNMLEQLLCAHDTLGEKKFSLDEVYQETVTLLVAGHETTANTICWALYLLAQHPEEQRILQEQVDRALTSSEPTLEAFASVPYAKWVLQEALRIYPTISIVPRAASYNTTLAGIPIREGMKVFPNLVGMHRNPKYWGDDADHFRPARFDPASTEAARRPPHAFAPFGGGVRVCVGRRFALQQGTVTLALLCKQFHFKVDPAHEVVPRCDITVGPKDGLHLLVTPR